MGRPCIVLSVGKNDKPQVQPSMPVLGSYFTYLRRLFQALDTAHLRFVIRRLLILLAGHASSVTREVGR